MTNIFISHRSTEEEVAEMLIDFFIATGISRRAIFCSSIPGNDVKEFISSEIKDALKSSIINIVILSKNYYKSAYCLNEAGVLWFQDKSTIVIALPEISADNMLGFLNSEYKIRRLDNENDIATIYEEIATKIDYRRQHTATYVREQRKLLEKYFKYLENRNSNKEELSDSILEEITTDDERVVLFYIAKNNKLNVKKENIINWMKEEEVYDIDVENAFNLLSLIGNSSIEKDCLKLDINIFRKLSKDSLKHINNLERCYNKHQQLSKDNFIKAWEASAFSDVDILFLSYIIEEKATMFGARWMAEAQIESIKNWEDQNALEAKLSIEYENCLSTFIQKKFVFESDWTSYDNPREYTLHKSLREYLFSKSFQYYEEIRKMKAKFYIDLPF